MNAPKRKSKIRNGPLEESLLFSIGLWFTGVFSGLRLLDGDIATVAALTNIIFYLLTWGVALSWILSRPMQILKIVKKNGLTFLYLGIAIASIAWSPLKFLSFTRCGHLGLLLSFCLFVSYRRTVQQQLQLWWRILASAAIISIIAELFFREYTLQFEERTFLFGSTFEGIKGFFPHKNNFSVDMSFLMLLSVFRLQTEKAKKFKYAAFAVTGFILVILSNSMTATVVAFTSLCLYYFLVFLGKRTRDFIVVLGSFLTATAIGAIVSAVMFAPVILKLFGRSEDLTGRFPIWALSTSFFMEKPIFGYGFDAFWPRSLENMGDFPQADLIMRALHWAVPHSHNGFLDIALQLGLVGASVVILDLALSTIRCARICLEKRTNPDEKRIGAIMLSVLFAIFIYNLFESKILNAFITPTFLHLIIIFNSRKMRNIRKVTYARKNLPDNNPGSTPSGDNMARVAS